MCIRDRVSTQSTGRIATTMATDAYYLNLHMKNKEFLEANKMVLTEEIPTRGVRHHRMSKQAKTRHTQILREKACEEPRRETVTGANDPLDVPEEQRAAILNRRQAEAVNNPRSVNGGFFTS
eukprot:TRINITY_DN11825_c0_g1_i1.p3 TRINITY_DN11825_c0_g1~~TRINITY_DN11825_c0_g1_i1.p3  ORF type:complete len:122 (+),score=28.86 TRINITY_DN11825_c0_g1_i1:110-475(+)